MTDDARPQLQALRNTLLDLHKALVDSERVSYETTMGAIQSPNQFLKLLMEDPWFAWLKPLSELIVTMDEAIEEKAPLADETVAALTTRARQLLVATETGEGFSRHYFEALQRDPDVVLAHAGAAKLFNPRKPAS